MTQLPFNHNPLEALKGSLQAEFEFELHGYNPRQDVLAAKKRQLELLRQLSNTTITIQVARRAEKPTGGLPKGFKSTMPTVKEIIKGGNL